MTAGKEGDRDLRQAEEVKRPHGKECVWYGVQEVVTSAEALGVVVTSVCWG